VVEGKNFSKCHNVSPVQQLKIKITGEGMREETALGKIRMYYHNTEGGEGYSRKRMICIVLYIYLMCIMLYTLNHPISS
jgi:hypothetical protein